MNHLRHQAHIVTTGEHDEPDIRILRRVLPLDALSLVPRGDDAGVVVSPSGLPRPPRLRKLERPCVDQVNASFAAATTRTIPKA